MLVETASPGNELSDFDDGQSAGVGSHKYEVAFSHSQSLRPSFAFEIAHFVIDQIRGAMESHSLQTLKQARTATLRVVRRSATPLDKAEIPLANSL